MSAGHLRSARLSGYMVLLRLSLSDRLATFSENEMKFFPKKILGAFGTESGRGRLRPRTMDIDTGRQVANEPLQLLAAVEQREKRCHIRHWNPPRFL